MVKNWPYNLRPVCVREATPFGGGTPTHKAIRKGPSRALADHLRGALGCSGWEEGKGHGLGFGADIEPTRVNSLP